MLTECDFSVARTRPHRGFRQYPSDCGYEVRILRRRRSCVGRRKPKPIANVIGIAIRIRVRVEVLETFPIRIPRVKVVGLPFANLAEMTTR